MKFTLIAKVDGRDIWSVVSNPNWGSGSELFAIQMLQNLSNEYVEYKNSSVTFRVVRIKDLKNYVSE